MRTSWTTLISFSMHVDQSRDIALGTPRGLYERESASQSRSVSVSDLNE